MLARRPLFHAFPDPRAAVDWLPGPAVVGVLDRAAVTFSQSRCDVMEACDDRWRSRSWLSDMHCCSTPGGDRPGRPATTGGHQHDPRNTAVPGTASPHTRALRRPGDRRNVRPAKPAERHRHRRIGLTEHRCRNRSVVHRRDTGSTPVRGVAAPTAPGAPATAPATPGASHSCTTGTCASSGAVAHTRAPPNRSVVLPTNVPSRSGLALRFRPGPTSRPDAEAPEFGPGNRWTHRRRD